MVRCYAFDTKRYGDRGKRTGFSIGGIARSVTCNAAYQYFEEGQKGVLRQGSGQILQSRPGSEPLMVPLQGEIRDIQVLQPSKKERSPV